MIYLQMILHLVSLLWLVVVSNKEVLSFIRWADENRMKINLKKTWELLLRGRSTRIPPEPLDIIERKDMLTLLGVTFKENPMNWDTV